MMKKTPIALVDVFLSNAKLELLSEVLKPFKPRGFQIVVESISFKNA